MANTLTGWTSRALLVTGCALAADSARAADAPGDVPRTDAERRIVVSIPDRKLALIEHEQVVRVFPVAVGAPESPSPVGTFVIVNRISKPTYYRPGRVIPPGASNPLGTRWLGLNLKGYGIHGTDVPRSIGQAQSHGCIRMRNQDVEQLFDHLRTGDVVELHAERTEEIARLFAQ